MKKIIILALSMICAFAVFIGFAFNDSSERKAYAAEDYVAGTNPTLGNTMFKVSSDGSALLLATAIENFDDVYQVGYDITVSTGEVDKINAPIGRYYSSLTLGEKTWYPSEIFGDSYADAKMIIWEIGYNPSYTYNIKAHAYVGYRRTSDNALIPAQGDLSVIKSEQASANVLSGNHTLSFENGDEVIADKSVTIGASIGTLPVISVKAGYTASAWKIDETTITAETKWRWSSDKTAVATYIENPIHDKSDHSIADIDLSSASDYTIATSVIDADFSGELVAVSYNEVLISCSYSNGNIVLDGDDVRDLDLSCGDCYFNVYTTTDTYRIKVLVVTMIITSVEDLNSMAAYGSAHPTDHTGYYILGNDIDCGGATINALSQYCGGTNYETNGFRGIFDGRGHIIFNATLTAGYLFSGIGNNAVVKNFALIDPVQSVEKKGALAVEIQGATITNVLVRSQNASMIHSGLYNASSAENIVFISTGGNGTKKMMTDFDGSAITNAIYIADGYAKSDTFGYGTHTVTNAYAYNTIGDMLEELSDSDYISSWNSTYIAYDPISKQIEFNGTPVYINADIELGTAFSISGIVGNVTAFRTVSGDSVDLASNNVITAEELYEAAGVYWSEGLSLMLITDSNSYLVNAALATKIITSVQGLNAMATYGSEHTTAHTGYYILGNDIDCDGTTVNALSQYCGGNNYETNGFRGVFDGRGHIILNARLTSNYLFSGIGKNAVVKNFALIDPIQTEERNGAFAGEVQGATISNVLVRSATVSMVNGGLFNASKAENVVFISTGGTGIGRMMTTLADGSTINNAAYVKAGYDTGISTFGYGTHTITNARAYNAIGDMIDDLSESDFISGWTSKYISYDSSINRIKYGDTLIIAADIELGRAFDISGISENVIAIKAPGGSRINLANDNVITASELNSAAGVNWSENLPIKLITENNSYFVNAAFITKIITSVSDLNAMATYGSGNPTDHTGYYILGNDIDCGWATVNSLSQYCDGSNYLTNGFRGVFDGRGHIISNARLASGYLFDGIGSDAVVKNFALIDPVQTIVGNGTLANRVQGATISNVLVRSATVSMVNTGLFGASRAENVLFISTGGTGTKRMMVSLTNGSTIYNAVYVVDGYDPVESDTFGSGTHTVVYAHAYNTIEDMLNELSESDYISGWRSPYISFDSVYVSGSKLRKLIAFNGVLVENIDYDFNALYTISVPSYSHTADMLIADGKTEYQIVIAEDANSDIYNAAIELNAFIYEATGTTFSIRLDKDVKWSNDAKFISLGDNLIADAAGSLRPEVNDRGYSIKKIGKSLFLRGSGDYGTTLSIYGLLSEILDFECYSSDEYEIAKTNNLYLPDIDQTYEPDIETLIIPSGFVSNNYKQRLTYQGSSFMYPEGGGPWHNSFDYFPKAEYQSSHPKWYATDGKNLCLTARGDSGEYNALVSATVDKMKTIITNNPNSKTITFTQQDVATWCTCSACSANYSKYGTDAGTVIMFMNDVVEQVETWRGVTFPERDDIRYIFFAYCTTGAAPVRTSFGRYYPKDSDVTPNEKIGVIFVTSADTSYTRTEMQKWHAIVGDNLYCWFYQTYFKNYFLPYCDLDTIQGNFQAMDDNGAVWLYYQSQWNNGNSTGFEVLKTYVESKLGWNVDADVDTLTDDFFKYYFREASDYMKEYYDELCVKLTNTDFGSETGVILTKSAFTKDTLKRWKGYIDSSYTAIQDISDPQLKNKVYDRIRLESLAVRYMLIELYGTEIWSDDELTEQKLLFKIDCKELHITRCSEFDSINELWPDIISSIDPIGGDNYGSDNSYDDGAWKGFD